MPDTDYSAVTRLSAHPHLNALGWAGVGALVLALVVVALIVRRRRDRGDR